MSSKGEEGLPRRCASRNDNKGKRKGGGVKKYCSTCMYLYVKDFIYGICENARGPVGIRKPNDVCEYWEQDKEDGNA